MSLRIFFFILLFSTFHNYTQCFASIELVQPPSNEYEFTRGSSIKIMWRYSLDEMKDDLMFFCGYIGKDEGFVILAVDFNGTEFKSPVHLQGFTQSNDNKKILPRISHLFAGNKGSVAKRGLTINNLSVGDQGIYQCGLHTSYKSGITYRGSLLLKMSSPPPRVDKLSMTSSPSKNLGSLAAKWIIGLAVFIPLTMLIIGIYISFRKGKNALEYSLASDHESLLEAAGESDDEEDVHFERKK